MTTIRHETPNVETRNCGLAADRNYHSPHTAADHFAADISPRPCSYSAARWKYMRSGGGGGVEQ